MATSTSRKSTPLGSAARSRFELKRDRIVDAATALINERGVIGTTLADVAQTVDLNTTGVTYYFRRKEQLAAAVFENTLVRIEKMAVEASLESTPIRRVARFVELHFEALANSRRDRTRGLALLSDIRALDDEPRAALERQYQHVFRLIRDFFGHTDDSERKTLLTARAHMLTEVVFWLPAWTDQYATSDFARLQTKVIDILTGGVAAPDRIPDQLAAGSIDAPEAEAVIGRETYLRAATRLINKLGYRGASVDRIVAELNISKGSFYHHLDAKDDLVLECFLRSYGRISRAQELAATKGGSHLDRLSAALTMLLKVQFEGDWPLLRTTALQALPTEVRRQVVERSNRTALRIAGTLVDGISDGSIRTLDPMVASQIVMATINAAYDLRHWAERLPCDKAVALYASTLLRGLFD